MAMISMLHCSYKFLVKVNEDISDKIVALFVIGACGAVIYFFLRSLILENG